MKSLLPHGKPAVLMLLASFTCSCAAFQRAWDCVSLDDSGKASINLMAVSQSNRNTCSLACLSAVANFWGIHASEQAIRSKIGKPNDRDGYTLAQLRDWAREQQLQAFVVHADIAFIAKQTELGRPVIVTCKQGKGNHSVVALAVDSNNNIIAMDPAKGRNTTFPAKTFLEKWEALGSPALLIARKAATTNDSPDRWQEQSDSSSSR